jgi:hypothetical protein
MRFRHRTSGQFGVLPAASTNGIFIGSLELPADSNKIKIRDTQGSAFIAGIRAITTGQNNAVPMLMVSPVHTMFMVDRGSHSACPTHSIRP